ncbi:MAG: hypothetical protein K0R66_1250 [Gammaproteobacteria bacterium]|jgi:hypothetical protein|nr:hypothetical protein [Gammaproteobacteria bacterium]
MHPAIAFSRLGRKFIDPYPLHTAVMENDESKVEWYLDYLKDHDVLVKELNTYGHGTFPIHMVFPLTHPMDRLYNYSMAIKLLEAGTKPRIAHPIYGSLFHFALSHEHLELFRLSLWYEPSYEDALHQDNKTNIVEFLASWLKRHPTLRSCLEKAINDSRRMVELLRIINTLSQDTDAFQIAEHYKEIAGLYLEQANFERDNNSYAKNVLEAHYKDKASSYQEKAYTSYKLAEEAFHQLVNPNPGQIDDYKQTLRRLISISATMGRVEEARIYQVSSDLLKLPSRPQRHHVISVAGSESAVPFLASELSRATAFHTSLAANLS